MDDYFTITRQAPVRGADGVLEQRVHLAGELDLGARDELRDALVPGVGALVVDLGDVTFIDSEAIGALLDGHAAATAAGTSLRLINANGLVWRVFEIIGMTPMLDGQSPAPA